LKNNSRQYILIILRKQGANTRVNMKYYPLFLNVREKNCLVVGGGGVGTRKALGLARAGARVQVVSPVFSKTLAAGAGSGVTLVHRAYDRSDLSGMFLVFAATSQADVNRQIQADAGEMGVLCNVADAPDRSDFILPGVVAQGDLLVAVSTCGASPAMAKKIRKDLETLFGPEYGRCLRLMARIRSRLLAGNHDPAGHAKLFSALVEKDLPGLIAQEDFHAVDQILSDLLGPEYLYQDLVSQE
jgi:precorrin-2 dehydrogenase/sirohydrochlorin ferrochelatase